MRKRYELDPDGRPKMDDKSNGTEWITIGNIDFYAMATTQPVFNTEPDPGPDPDELPIDLFIPDMDDLLK